MRATLALNGLMVNRFIRMNRLDMRMKPSKDFGEEVKIMIQNILDLMKRQMYNRTKTIEQN